MKSYFITGTGTGIGKTRFTGLFARLAVERGLRTAVMKPVQTGVPNMEAGDIGCVRRLAPGLLELPKELACPYMLGLEASPHLAAEGDGVEIDFTRIGDAFEEIERVYKPDLLLMEGAGGVCVPLSRRILTSKLIAWLGKPAIVAADARLGTINHTVLTVDWLRREDVEVAGVAINRMPSKPGPIEKDNVACVESFAKTEVLAILPEVEEEEAGERGFLSCEGLERLIADAQRY